MVSGVRSNAAAGTTMRSAKAPSMLTPRNRGEVQSSCAAQLAHELGNDRYTLADVETGVGARIQHVAGELVAQQARLADGQGSAGDIDPVRQIPATITSIRTTPARWTRGGSRTSRLTAPDRRTSAFMEISIASCRTRRRRKADRECSIIHENRVQAQAAAARRSETSSGDSVNLARDRAPAARAAPADRSCPSDCARSSSPHGSAPRAPAAGPHAAPPLEPPG